MNMMEVFWYACLSCIWRSGIAQCMILTVENILLAWLPRACIRSFHVPSQLPFFKWCDCHSWHTHTCTHAQTRIHTHYLSSKHSLSHFLSLSLPFSNMNCTIGLPLPPSSFWRLALFYIYYFLRICFLPAPSLTCNFVLLTPLIFHVVNIYL